MFFTVACLFQSQPAEGKVVRFFTTTAERLPLILDNDLTSGPFVSTALQNSRPAYSQQVFDGPTGQLRPDELFGIQLVFDYDFDTGRFTNLLFAGDGVIGAELYIFTEDGSSQLINGLEFFPTINNGNQLLTFRTEADVQTSTFVEFDGLLPAGGGRVDFVPFNADNADLLADPVGNPTLDFGFLTSSPGTGYSFNVPRFPNIAESSDLSYGGITQAELDDQPIFFDTEAFLYGVVIPEPNSLALLSLGIPLLLHRRRRLQQATDA
ncbi:MAG: PEP-CTERM sorting domain-containing protein [Planctomycetota bacterium]